MLGRSWRPGSDHLSIISITDLSQQGEREKARQRAVITVAAARRFHLAEANAAFTAAQPLTRPRSELDSHYRETGGCGWLAAMIRERPRRA